MRQTREELLSNPRVRSWYEARCLKSKLSADTDLRKVALALQRLGLDPDSVVAMATENPDELRDRLVRYASELKREQLTDAYISKTFSGLRNYLKFRRAKYDDFPSLEPIKGSTLARERVPSPEELGRILDRLSLRSRVAALFMAHTGVRPQVLGSYEGERGLTLSDLPELELRPTPRFRDVPFVVRVPAQLSKTRASYVTFGTGQLAQTFLAYLDERAEAGEKLGPASPVVSRTSGPALRGVAKTSAESAGRFMVTAGVMKEIRRAIHAAAPEGVTWRPYVLRSYCSTRLLLGPMSRDLRESMLGHDTGIAGRYTVGKRWGPELLAEARVEYANSAHLLETTAATKGDTKQVLLASLISAVERATGKDAPGPVTQESLKAILRDALGAGSPLEPVAVQAASIPPPRRACEERAVDAELVGRYLDLGWVFRSPLNSHLAVVRWDGAPGTQ